MRRLGHWLLGLHRDVGTVHRPESRRRTPLYPGWDITDRHHIDAHELGYGVIPHKNHDAAVIGMTDKRPSPNTRMDVDAVVLDIDGVLVDTSQSYKQAVVETIRVVYDVEIEKEYVQQFKNAGGFNNDWHVTDALALYVLASDSGYDRSIEAFTSDIESHGGGLSAAQHVLHLALGEHRFDAVRRDWEQERLRRTFQWLYLGPDRYEQFESAAPPPDQPPVDGLMDAETILVDDETIATLQAHYPMGVLTGRPSGEATIALERVGLDIPRHHLISMDDWDGGKPDPDGLMTLATRLDADTIAYAGDELDDVRTAVNATTRDSDRTYYGIGVQSGGVTGKAGKARFESVGATAVLESINELPAVLDA